MKTFLAILSLLVPIQAYADNDHGSSWNTPKTGIWITPSASSFQARKTGEAQSISGEICRVWIGSSSSSPSCLKLKDKNLEVHAFYPDATQEVTSQVSLDRQDRKIKFNYNIAAVSGSPVFTILVGYFQGSTLGLMKAKAKLEKRIQAIAERIAELQLQGGHAHLISDLEKLKSNLVSVVAKINLKLAARPEIIAQYEIPLQVDNQRVSPSHYFSDLGGFRFDFKFDPGHSIEGDKAQVSASITNLLNQPPSSLLNGDDLDDNEDGDRDSDDSDKTLYHWSADLYWQGVKVKAFAPQALPDGQSLAYSFSTEALAPESSGNPNLIQFDLFRNRLKSNGNGYTNKTRWGKLKKFHQVSPDNVAPIWLAGSSIAAQPLYAQNMNLLSAIVKDNFGLIDPQGFEAKLNSADISAQLQFIKIDQGQSYQVQGDLNPLAEGDYTISLKAKDLADNFALPNPLSKSFHIDRTKPMITLGLQDGTVFSHSPIDLPVTVLDASPVLTVVKLNDQAISQSSQFTFTQSLVLSEGMNFIEVQSTDAAGNVSNVNKINLFLDTTPPMLSQLTPSSGAVLNTLSFNVSGRSNEALSYAKLNGQSLTLSLDKMSFSGIYSAQIEGALSLHWEAADLVGNVTTVDSSVQIILKVLNGDLLSVVPAPNNHLIIRGAPGATRPGLTVRATSGFFNNGTAIGATDGSFSITMSAFSSATVSATDPSIGRTDTVSVSFGSQSGTMLSGVVKDTDGAPLSHVLVSLANTDVVPVYTDGSGVFMFQQPVTGDQILIVDGSSVVSALPPAPQRKFSKTAVSISIGLSQSNVLQRPIYLASIPLDGSATVLDINSGNSNVTHPDAPGVSLNIPAGVAQFPDGQSSGAVSLKTISAEFSTIVPLAIAQPKHVVALEPSGMSFSEPVELTLPNVDELPAGVEVVILSMDSRKGIWTVDGAATVSSDGHSVVTKPGMGITHFSTVYAAPIGPTVKQIGAQDKPGANAFDGALTTNIKLPSYKSLGQDISPSLIYKSAWAKPTVLVTNMFDIPERRLLLDTSFTLVRRISAPACFVFCFTADADYYTQVDTQVNAWYQPDKIVAQFLSENIVSAPLTFTGVPSRAAISFALDLKDPATGNYINSGIYAYDSHYEVHLKETVITTRRVTSWTDAKHPVVTQDIDPDTQVLNEVFPQDLGGTILIQNKAASEAGRGWAISGAQRILNPDRSRLMIEEADGGTSTYALDNTIQTLLDANNSELDVSRATDVSVWPHAYLIQRGTNNFYRSDLSKTNPTSEQFMGATPVWSGTIAGEDNFLIFPFPNGTGRYSCEVQFYFYNYASNAGLPEAILPFPDGSIQSTDSTRSTIFRYDYPLSGSFYANRTAGLTQPKSFRFHGPNANQELPLAILNYCATTPGLSCSPFFGVQNHYTLPIDDPDRACENGGAGFGNGSGDLPFPGINGDGSPATGIQLNRPMGIAAGPRPNTAVVADTGNNRVRIIDYNTNSVSTIVGNGTTFDNGDGGPATNAGIFHPRGVIYDSVGNLYITTENGLIRKVDTTGRITTFAGNVNGTAGDSLPASQVVLRRPYGMAIDNDNGYLYVAEQDSHLVRRIDFQTRTAITVAGSGVPGYNGDGIPALNASLSSPKFLGLDDQKNLIIVDSGNQRIRRVAFQNTGTGILAYKPTAQDHTSLVRNADGSFTRNFRNGTQVFFDANGRQTASVDKAGRVTAFNYDAQGRLTSIVDPAGRQIVYHYSGALLSSITDPANRTTNFNYDGAGNLILVIFPDYSSRSFTYDSSGLMLSETNERGITTQYTYNEWNRLASVTRADGKSITINDSGSATAANNYTGGNVGTLKSMGTGSNQVYDGIKDAKSVETKFVKDVQGYVTTVTDGTGRETKIRRDIKGKPTLITRPDLSTVTFHYDPNTDDLLSQTDTATNTTTSQSFDSFGNLLTQTNGRGFTSSNQYDPVSTLLLSKTDPLGHAVSYQYNNSLKLVTHVTNSLGKTTVSQYDSAGNLSSVTDPLGKATSYIRDLAGNVISTTNAQNQTTHYEYDVFNRLTAVVTPKNERTEYSYLASGELSQIKDPKGNISTFEYDFLGRMTKKTDALGFSITRSYDENGNVIQEVDPNGNVKNFVYDTLNQLVQKSLPDNTYNLAYDVRGNLIQAKNSQSQADFDYDASGKLLSYQTQGLGGFSSLPAVSLSFQYDQNGNRIVMNDPVGQTSYQYDAADRLTSLRNPKSEDFAFSYDVGNRLTSLSRPGSNSAFAFDDANFLTSIVHSGNVGSIATFNYQRNNIGNITQIASLLSTKNFSYDNNNQLVSSSNPEASGSSSYQAETFSYDSVYNRTQDQGGNYNYDQKSQRLIEDYKFLYLYDNNGNLITKTDKNITGEVTNYSYTSENQLISFRVYVPGNSNPVKEVSYAYDALGRRVQKQVVDHVDSTKSFTRRYAYDGQEILLEYDGSNNLLARYTHSSLRTDDVLSVDVTSAGVSAKLAQNSGSYQYLKDHQGTITDVADNSGNKLQHYVYSAFGILLGIKDASANDVTENPPLNTSYTYTGREQDKESGFYYYRARYYDPNTGRFLQKDPEPGKIKIPSTAINSYIYVSNNPWNLTDPTGRGIFSFLETFFIGIVGAAAAFFAAPFVVTLLGINSMGGVTGAILGGLVGGVTGAIAGGLAGGLAGGIINAGKGRSFTDGFWGGAAIGAVSGAITGAVVGAFTGYGNGVSASSTHAEGASSAGSCLAIAPALIYTVPAIYFFFNAPLDSPVIDPIDPSAPKPDPLDTPKNPLDQLLHPNKTDTKLACA